MDKFGVVHRVWISCKVGWDVVKSMRTVAGPVCQYRDGSGDGVNDSLGG